MSFSVIIIQQLGSKKAAFVLVGIDTYSVRGFAFNAHNVSAKTPIHRLTECHGISHSIVSNQETHFTAREVHSEPMFMESTGHTMFSSTLKQLA